jgi:hypothetical protein
MRKWTTALAILSLAGSTAIAANIDTGTRELILSGGVDFDTADDTQFDVGVGYGYFFWDNVEVIGSVGVSDNKARTQWDFGVGAEYNWDPGGDIIPYVGLTAAMAGIDRDLGDNENAGVLTLSLGTKFFIRDMVAPFIALDWSAATEDIYDEKDGVQSDELVLAWGIRFFWD